MYINMTPDKTNKTLHASQDDTTRQFKFKLVDDSQVLDTSDTIPPVIYDVEPNGTEQLLPVNSSTPTTSPIIADIKYPDELRQDQEFFERITPTTLKGQAKIEKIKGHTLVFNQLIQNGNFADTSVWTVATPVSFTVQNNIATVITNTDGDYNIRQLIPMIIGHKYIYFVDCWTDDNTYTEAIIFYGGASDVAICEVPTNNTWASFSGIFTCVSNQYNFIRLRNQKIGITNKFRNVSIIDLTLMFGSGNEPTTVKEFTSLFPLPYYDYNAGSLLSFNGTGIKTRPNIINGVEQGTYDGSGNPSSDSARLRNVGGLIPIEEGKSYTLTFNKNNNLRFAVRLFNDTPSLIYDSGWKTDDFTVNTSSYSNAKYIAVVGSFISNGAITPSDVEYMYVYEVGVDETYPLPISTYFPSGMKSAGTVYDELTPAKAITRVGSVDMGTLNWLVSIGVTPLRFEAVMPSGYKKPATSAERNRLICSKYSPNSSVTASNNETGITNYQNLNVIFVRDLSYNNVTAFKTAMSGIYLYYELATPTEEDIESCSLVSEDIEKPLEYDSGFLVCESDGLTSKSGFIPCKIKQAKGNETLYSQLINLHIERRP